MSKTEIFLRFSTEGTAVKRQSLWAVPQDGERANKMQKDQNQDREKEM